MAELKTVIQRQLQRALAKGDLGAAGAFLKQLQAEDPVSLETRGLELEYLLRKKLLEEASELASQLLELFPESPRIHFLAAQVAYQRREYPSAEAHLRESARLHDHWSIQWKLGQTLTQLGEFEEAEARLVPLVSDHPHCWRDLAWLHERKGDFHRALEAVSAYLRRYPEDRFALQQKTRLRARAMEPQELIEEIAQLGDLGEPVPPEVLPEYLESLLRSGRGAEARRFVREALPELDPRVAKRAGWACYHLQAYDLAFDLMRKSFAENQSNVKFLGALEASAARSGSLELVVPLYEAFLGENPRFYARLRRVRERLEKEGEG